MSNNLPVDQSQFQRIDELADRFEEAWKAHLRDPEIHRRPQIEEYLKDVTEADRSEARKELIRVEVECRRRGQQQPTAEEYLSRFPEDGPVFCSLFPDDPRLGPTMAAAGQNHDDRENAVAADGQPTIDKTGLPVLRRFGDYLLLRVPRDDQNKNLPEGALGGGGMGVVYMARELQTDRLVVLKLISIAGRDARKRFKREIRATAKSQHDHIVPVLHADEIDGQLYYTMPFVEGSSLDKVVKREGPLSNESAARYIEQAARAVHDAHQHGILHRDLKPHNLLWETESDRVLVSDFGLAKFIDEGLELTGSGGPLGTVQYMAPEQAKDPAGVTVASDVYGLGATLYHLLTGRPPFQAATQWDLQQKVIEESPRPPRQHNPAVDGDLELICLKCLEKEPNRRFPSAEALARGLSGFLAGEPSGIRRVGPLERAWLWCRRKPAIAAAVLLVALSLMAGTAVSSYFAVTATDERDRANQKAAEAIDAEQRAVQAAEGESSARAEAEKSLRERERQLARNYIERGVAECEAGRTAIGLALLADAYETVADQDPLRVSAGSLLAGWGATLGNCLLHDGPIRTVAFSRDGKRILTGGEDTFRLWDLKTGQPIGQPLRHEEPLDSAAFSPDGKRVLTRSKKTARLWDAVTAQAVGQPLRDGERLKMAVFSPDGKRVLTGSEDANDVPAPLPPLPSVPADQPPTLDPYSDPSMTAPSLSPMPSTTTPGPTTASISADPYKRENSFRLWDAETAEPIGQPVRHERGVLAVAFGPAGKTLLTGGRDSAARLWDAATGEPIGEPMRHEGAVDTVAFSPDGKRALTGSDNGVRLWDADTGRPIGDAMRHQGRVLAVAFSPDGKRVLTGSDDSTARLWVAETQQLIGTPMRHEEPVDTVAFSPDGKRVVTGSVSSFRLWDAETQQPVGEPLRDATSPRLDRNTGPTLAPTPVFAPTESSMWMSSAVQPLRHDKAVDSLALGADGKSVLATRQDVNDLPVSLRFVSSMQADGSSSVTPPKPALTTYEPVAGSVEPLYYREPLNTVAFALDGKRVLTGNENSFRLWNADSGEPLGRPLSHSQPLSAVALTGDGRTVVTGSVDSTAHLWDADTGQPIGQPMRHEKPVNTVAFSPDGKWVVTGSDDSTARIWNTQIGRPIGPATRHEDTVWAVAFSSDGKRIVTGSGNTARRWDAETGQSIGELSGYEGRPVALSPDGKMVLTAWVQPEQTSRQIAGNVESFTEMVTYARLWDAETGEPAGQAMRHQGPVHAAALSADGKRVLMTWSEWENENREYVETRYAGLWGAQTGQPLGEPMRLEGPVRALALSRDGKRVLAGSDDGTACVWDAENGQLIGQPMRHDIVGFIYRPTPVTVTYGGGGGLRYKPVWKFEPTSRLWDPEAGPRILREPTAYGDAIPLAGVWAVAFSPDGKTLLTGSEDGVARLWDAESSRPLGQPMRHERSVTALAFSRDGKRLVTGSHDGTARLWDAETGQAIGLPMCHAESVSAVAFSPDGKRFLTASGKTVRLWPVPQPVSDDPERVRLWVEVLCARTSTDGTVRRLTVDQWLDRRKRLDRLGGPLSIYDPEILLIREALAFLSLLSENGVVDEEAARDRIAQSTTITEAIREQALQLADRYPWRLNEAGKDRSPSEKPPTPAATAPDALPPLPGPGDRPPTQGPLDLTPVPDPDEASLEDTLRQRDEAEKLEELVLLRQKAQKLLDNIEKEIDRLERLAQPEALPPVPDRIDLPPLPDPEDTEPDPGQPDPQRPVRPKDPPSKTGEPAPAKPHKVVGELKVSIRDLKDPIAIDTTTTYLVVIENARNVLDRNVKLTIHLPEGMEFVKLSGPVAPRSQSPDGRTIEVTPIAEMHAGESLNRNPFYIEVRGVEIGKHTVKVTVDSLQSAQPVEAQQETTVDRSG